MPKMLQDAYIVAATRTPVGKAPRGMFKNVRPDTLLAHVLQNVLLQVPTLEPRLVEDVIVGCAMPEAEQGMNVARIGILLAALPNTIPGVTINRFCSSGVNAIAMAAERIQTGSADVMIAAGTESMSMVPMMGNKIALNSAIFDREENIAIAYGMGLTAEKVAKQWEVSRDAQDAFALQSHQKAARAIAQNEFQTEITPFSAVEYFPDLESRQVSQQARTMSVDEGVRADASIEALAKLKPAFVVRGSVTAGNSSQMSDGAAALVLVSEKMLKQYQLQPLARWVGFSVAGVPPEIMGIGPIAAIPKVLKNTGVNLNDIDWIELNEAFAAQSLAVMRELNLDPSKVNPLGGAIALGHPLGATGAIRMATLIHGLKRRQQKYGMVTMCIGTGMGAAGIVEAV